MLFVAGFFESLTMIMGILILYTTSVSYYLQHFTFYACRCKTLKINIYDCMFVKIITIRY
ncbi:B-lymphocyte antigen CD20 [Bienertia sinuspersici]